MGDHQADIKLEMRLSAIEYMLSKFYIATMQASRLSNEQMALVRQQILEGVRQHKFSGLDPVMSDLASAEWEEAIARLLEMQRQMAEQATKK